jgi:hypothetical protein
MRSEVALALYSGCTYVYVGWCAYGVTVASAITAKPAMRDHFKTGHMIHTQDLHLF